MRRLSDIPANRANLLWFDRLCQLVN